MCDGLKIKTSYVLTTKENKSMRFFNLTGLTIISALVNKINVPVNDHSNSDERISGGFVDGVREIKALVKPSTQTQPKIIKKIETLGNNFQNILEDLKERRLSTVEFIKNWDEMIIRFKKDFVKPLEETIINSGSLDPKAHQANLINRCLVYYDISKFFIEVRDYYNAYHYFKELEKAFKELKQNPEIIDLETKKINQGMVNEDMVNGLRKEVKKLDDLLIDHIMSKSKEGFFTVTLSNTNENARTMKYGQ